MCERVGEKQFCQRFFFSIVVVAIVDTAEPVKGASSEPEFEATPFNILLQVEMGTMVEQLWSKVHTYYFDSERKSARARVTDWSVSFIHSFIHSFFFFFGLCFE